MADWVTGVYLVRHADALPDADCALEDGTLYDDLRLSERGKRQALALGERLRASVALDAIYASPASRAVETAEAVASGFGYPVLADSRLCEVGLAHRSIDHLPPLERAAALRAQLHMLADVAMREGSWSSLPGTEAGTAIRARMRAAVDELAERHAGGAIAIVSHAGAINAYIAEVLGVQRDFFFPTGNASITLVRVSPERRVLVRLNDTAHLERRKLGARGAAGEPA